MCLVNKLCTVLVYCIYTGTVHMCTGIITGTGIIPV